jgi:uncharacterized membrane protein
VLLLGALGWDLAGWPGATVMRRQPHPAKAAVFVWLLMGLALVSMPFTGWWLVHLVGWPLGQTWLLASSVLYTVAALAWFWLLARLNAAQDAGWRREIHLALALFSLSVLSPLPG